MWARVLAFFLLFSLAFSLSAGILPCQEREEAPASQRVAAMSGHCHEAAATPEQQMASSSGDHGCCDPEGSHPCQHACHFTAVAAPLRVSFAIGPVAELPRADTGRTLPPPAQPIDHIPLA